MPGGDTRTGTFHLPYPLFIARGEGCHLWDADGHQYLDVLNNFTSLVHGHGHTAVVRAIADQTAKGTVHGTANALAGRPGRSAVPARAVGRAPALLQLGHRGDDGGAARRQGLHRPAEDPQDGRRLPRLARPGGRGRVAALRRRAARAVAGRGRRSDRRRVQRPRSHRVAHPRPPERTGRGDRRADHRHRRAARRPRLPRGPARGHHRVRRAARLRRGDHASGWRQAACRKCTASSPTSPASARSSAAGCRWGRSADAPTSWPPTIRAGPAASRTRAPTTATPRRWRPDWPR